jgi:hypothetical protein
MPTLFQFKDDSVYRAALAAEADAEHDEDRDLWDSLSADGLEDHT